jgi:RimJ/RimL family protein N-acetyltransferase
MLPLATLELNRDIRLVPVDRDKTSLFIDFENSQRDRQVGKALKEHLEALGPFFALMALANEKLVGSIRARIFHELDPTHRTVLIAHFCVDKDYQGLGIGSAMVKHLVSSYKRDEQIHAIAAEVDYWNLPSLRVFEKNQFKPSMQSLNIKKIILKNQLKAQ